MSRVGNHHISRGHVLHHPALGHFTLELSNLAFNFWLALSVLVFVFHLLLGHAQFFLVIENLEWHVDHRNDNCRARQQEETPGDGPEHVLHGWHNRLFSNRKKVLCPQVQYQNRDSHHQANFGDGFDQFNQ